MNANWFKYVIQSCAVDSKSRVPYFLRPGLFMNLLNIIFLHTFFPNITKTGYYLRQIFDQSRQTTLIFHSNTFCYPHCDFKSIPNHVRVNVISKTRIQ